MSVEARLLELQAAKLAWEQLSYQEQAAYLKAHPTSKKRITQMSPQDLAEHHKIIQQTYANYHKSTRGTQFKDFIGRPTAVDDAEHHRRTNFYIWRGNIHKAIKDGTKIPAKVLADYTKRSKMYDKGGAAAYALVLK